MAEAKKGDTVTIDFTARLKDGQPVAESGEAGETFKIGEGRLFLAVEEALVGMDEGDEKNVNVPAAEGFGEHSKELLFKVERARLPADAEIKPGLVLTAQGPDNQPIRLVVREVQGDQVILDGNHPLAGQDVEFSLKLREIVSDSA